ncbi:CAP-Gly domain-containing linker protein 3-like isoform X2 [Actinia tenebrosa]|uniref:CAP-Gly domain-containing linker protein 3-like isoform X2 n=1 Tax=Actinia tenebrosa TaxID=6105 RepID=A0A6P8HND3_ACTTE|nr:CAP-Gly domain-containing linker protein 3-like isoform X2 [Actinia tenebrosa]
MPGEVQDTAPEPGFTVSDFIMPTRDKPMIHPASDAILCENCQKLELTFFDPNCPGCLDLLLEPKTTIPQLFAIMRQWVPQVQQNIGLLVKEILRRGANVNDRDGLTDMSMLHYACKAGAVGVGDVTSSTNVVRELITKGVDVSQRCRWTDMLPLHYAAFFDIAPVIDILLKASKSKDVNARCKEFDNGTALHIASSNLCIEAVKSLLDHGADVSTRDKLNRIALDCVPNVAAYEPDSEPAVVAASLTQLLSEAEPPTTSHDKENLHSTSLSLGIKIGDRVWVGGTKEGVLRFCGVTEFAAGEWAGIELDEPVGKNDGSVGGVAYFHCRPNHGIFAPSSKIAKEPSQPQSIARPSSLPTPTVQQTPNQSSQAASLPHSRTSGPSSRDHSRSSSPAPSPHDVNEAEIAEKFELNDRVVVAGQKSGRVQYIGQTQFASGWWLGVELDQPVGKNDGSVGGVRYFTCKPRYGVFAPVTKVKNLTAEDSFAVPTAPAPKTHHNSHGSLHETSSKGSQNDLSGSNSDLAGHKQINSLKKTPANSNSNSRRGSADSIKKASLGSRKAQNYEFKLTEGMSILVNSELGVVRYIGTVDFADGLWLGVEMRKPVGKNDGSVNEKRYFTCKPSYGLMVRPSRASCRGINCAKLVEDITS